MGLHRASGIPRARLSGAGSIIDALARKGTGMTRDEVAQTAGLANSGTLTKRLKELESCGFIPPPDLGGQVEGGCE